MGEARNLTWIAVNEKKEEAGSSKKNGTAAGTGDQVARGGERGVPGGEIGGFLWATVGVLLRVKTFSKE